MAEQYIPVPPGVTVWVKVAIPAGKAAVILQPQTRPLASFSAGDLEDEDVLSLIEQLNRICTSRARARPIAHPVDLSHRHQLNLGELCTCQTHSMQACSGSVDSASYPPGLRHAIVTLPASVSTIRTIGPQLLRRPQSPMRSGGSRGSWKSSALAMSLRLDGWNLRLFRDIFSHSMSNRRERCQRLRLSQGRLWS
jgi:hypothetical protein